MKKTEKDENFTQTSNTFLEHMCVYRFASVLESALVLAVHRYTAGFHRDEAKLSLRFLAEYVERPYTKVSPAINELVRKRVLTLVEDKSKGNQPRVFSVNLNFAEWDNGVPVKGTPLIDRVPLDGNSRVTTEENSGVPSCGNKEIKINKKRNKEACDSSDHGNKTGPRADMTTTQKRQTKKGKGKILVFEDIIIPVELVVVPGFIDHYKDWYEFRKELGHPLTPTAAKRNMKFLTEQHQKGADPIALILYAINNGYRGLFELPKSRSSSSEIYSKIKSDNEHLRL